ncbi:Bromodomain protein [Dictyocaulus viviparus]|uniref:Bromodomain protein n=1 Tax=Dictyocaulus viviparus TaxID=29172 RepID=A0A0D8Y482_DICVI|nr:Bromodomain protein [Dictyocaulus viviparus]
MALVHTYFFKLGLTLFARRTTSHKEQWKQTTNGVNKIKFLSGSYRFDFENNEDEERAIAEAIAREEELMRQEEFDKGCCRTPGGRDPAGRPYDEGGDENIKMSSGVGSAFYSALETLEYSSNLSIQLEDNIVTRVVKQTLETMILQVCRWDKQFGWYRNLFLREWRPRIDGLRRCIFSNKKVTTLTEHSDRLRKEINKRRTLLENQAENMCGLPTPWRKSRMKSCRKSEVFLVMFNWLGRPRTSKSVTGSKSSHHLEKPINPADISLGGNTVDCTRNSKAEISVEEKSSLKPPPVDVDPSKLLCVCPLPHSAPKSHITCNMCLHWFHEDCLGVTETNTKKSHEWTCRNCQLQRQETDQEEKFYVGCECCEGWFHPQCVGITEQEVEAMPEYLCPKCVEAQPIPSCGPTTSFVSSDHATLCRADYPLIWRLLECVTEHRMSWPFRQPVSLQEFPNYSEVIKNPIDLSIIQRRLENLEYQRLNDFTKDMSLLFRNAKLFNSQDSNIYHCADTLEKVFERTLTEVRREMDARENGRKVSESPAIDSSLDIDTDQLIDVNLDVDPTTLLL